MLGALALLLIAAPWAFADFFTPENKGGSRNADDIQTLFVIAMIIGGVIFAGVEGVLVYSLIRFRRRRGGPEPAQIRGNTPLEMGWTVGAAVIVAILAVITFAFLGGITTPERSLPSGATAGNPLQVASIDRALWLKWIIGADASVVASMATHIRPRCWASTMSEFIARKNSRSREGLTSSRRAPWW